MDDFGRYEGEPELIRSEAFPFGDPNGKVIHILQITEWLTSLVSADMVILYENEGKKLLQLTRWKERVRTDSKYPAPICGHLTANDSKCTQMIASPPSPSPSPSPSPTPSPTPGDSISEEIFKKLIGAFFKRPEHEAWGYLEEYALAEVLKRDWRTEWALIEPYLASVPAKDRQFVPASRSVSKLLEQWGIVLDHARSTGKHPVNGKSHSIGPKLSEVVNLCAEKWSEDERNANWATSFHTFWERREWKKNGRPIDWKVELSNQVQKWRTT